MALTVDVLAASATPVADLYTIITGLMTTAGWSLTSDSPITAAQAGNTGDAAENVAVNIWKNTGSTCFIGFAKNESGTAPARLRIRCSEGWDTTTHTVIHPVYGGSAGLAVTPQSNDSVAGTEDANDLTYYQAAGTSQKVGWVDIPVSAGGFSYVAGANTKEIVLATSVGGSARPSWCHAGVIPAGDNFTPSSTMCFLGGKPTAANDNTSWWVSNNGTSYCVSRAPNQGATSAVGLFACQVYGVSGSHDINVGWGGQPGSAHRWLVAAAAYTAYLHCGSTTGTVAAVRSHIARLSSMALCWHDTTDEIGKRVSLGETILLDGDVYYILGGTGVSNTAGISVNANAICAKNSAF